MKKMDNSKIQDLLKSCLLPELKQDLDSICLQNEHFKEYHDGLQIQLPLLYDWIQQEPTQWIFSQEVEKQQQEDEKLLTFLNAFVINLQIQSDLIILLCELSSSDALYKLDRTKLINNAERILAKFSKISPEVLQIIFQYYQDKLHKDSWKRQLGPIHGFVMYLKFIYMNHHNLEDNMSGRYLMFCLSVGLNIRSCHETHYKLLSTNIFTIMLKFGATDDVLSMNIHSVIYDAVFNDLHIMDSIAFIDKQWNCLLKCLDFYTDIDSFTWNKLDDSLEILLRNIPLAPNSLTSVNLLKFVSKFVVYFNINRTEFEEQLTKDLTQINAVNECRQLGSSNTSYTCYRWAKTILEMFILESYRLMQSTEICREMLMEIHRCYMVTLLPIGLPIIEPHLITFFQKFTAILMEVIKVQKAEDDIMQVILSILETFRYHLQNCENLPKLLQLKEAYHNLLQIEVFKKYACTF